MIDIFVDADACPVKDEIYAVATHHGVPVVLVANSPMHAPAEFGAQMIVVDGTPDAADDWIVENVRERDVVITADIPLAARCLELGASVLGTNGNPFDEDSIGGALASRDLKAHLRESGVATGGPRPLAGKDRSRFVSALHQMVEKALR